MKKHFAKSLLPMIGIIIFLYIIFFTVNSGALMKNILSADLNYFILIFFLSFFLVGLKSWRWKQLMLKQGIIYPFRDCFRMYSVGIFLSLITPGKIGEAAKIFYLNRDRHKLLPGIVSIIADRLADMIILAFLILSGFLIFWQYFLREFYIMTILIILSVLLLFLTIRYKYHLKIIKIALPEKYYKKISENSDSFFLYFGKYTVADYSGALLLTAAAWMIYILQVYLIALSLDVSLNFFFLMPMTAVANAADLLPISINGLGTREAIFIFFFSIINLPAETATAIGILQLFIVFSTALIGFFYWIKKPKENISD